MDEEIESVFVEKEIYVEPPQLPDDATEAEKLQAWTEWQQKEAVKRRAHKAAFTRRQKATALPTTQFGATTVKIGGVHRQGIGSIAIEGSEENIEQIVAVKATQDKHFDPRGKRSGNKKFNRKAKRRAAAKRKAQLILSKGKAQ